MPRTAERTEFLTDVLTTAVEGGIGYWGRVVDSGRDADGGWTWIAVSEFEDAINDLGLDPYGYGALDAAYDGSDERLAEYTHLVTLDDVARSMRRFEKETLVNGDMRRTIVASNRTNECEMDAYDADAVVQVAALGEVVYG